MGLKPMKADKTGRVRFLTTQEEAALRKALERSRGTATAGAHSIQYLADCSRQEATLPEREGAIFSTTSARSFFGAQHRASVRGELLRAHLGQREFLSEASSCHRRDRQARDIRVASHSMSKHSQRSSLDMSVKAKPENRRASYSPAATANV